MPLRQQAPRLRRYSYTRGYCQLVQTHSFPSLPPPRTPHPSPGRVLLVRCALLIMHVDYKFDLAAVPRDHTTAHLLFPEMFPATDTAPSTTTASSTSSASSSSSGPYSWSSRYRRHHDSSASSTSTTSPPVASTQHPVTGAATDEELGLLEGDLQEMLERSVCLSLSHAVREPLSPVMQSRRRGGKGRGRTEEGGREMVNQQSRRYVATVGHLT